VVYSKMCKFANVDTIMFHKQKRVFLQLTCINQDLFMGCDVGCGPFPCPLREISESAPPAFRFFPPAIAFCGKNANFAVVKQKPIGKT